MTIDDLIELKKENKPFDSSRYNYHKFVRDVFSMSKEQILEEFGRIREKTSRLSKKARDLLVYVAVQIAEVEYKEEVKDDN